MIPNSLLLKKDIEARRRGIRRMYKRVVCCLCFGAFRSAFVVKLWRWWTSFWRVKSRVFVLHSVEVSVSRGLQIPPGVCVWTCKKMCTITHYSAYKLHKQHLHYFLADFLTFKKHHVKSSETLKVWFTQRWKYLSLFTHLFSFGEHKENFCRTSELLLKVDGDFICQPGTKKKKKRTMNVVNL